MHTSSVDPSQRDGVIRMETETDGIVVLCVEGDFDIANASQLRDQIDSALEQGNDLVLDLGKSTFIDSSVINVLFDSAEAVQAHQTVVLQLGTAPIVERALELVAIDSVLPRAHDRQEAVRIIERRTGTSQQQLHPDD